MFVASPKWSGRYLPFGAANMSVAPPLFGRGLGAVAKCWGQVAPWSTENLGAIFSYAFSGCPLDATPIGVPSAPAGSVLTVPPASGVDAQATVDAQLNAQLAAQQALNAAGVASSPIDQAASAVVNVGDTLASGPGGVSWLVWLAGGLGIFGLVALSGGSPRRYGR